jgi:acetyl-CoA decarbonylase/synthase complex subunit beta
MIWGMIPPGQDHEMGHFLEQDFPGAMVVQGEVGSLEGLVLLALMKMGCPAIVDSSFPYDIGPRVVADSADEIIHALSEFPNMRVRLFHEQGALPEGADPAFARESFESARQIAGTFQLRPRHVTAGSTVQGDESAGEIAVIVEIDDSKLDLPISAHLEEKAAGFGSFLHGVKTSQNDGLFTVDIADGARFSGRMLCEVIRAGLLRDFPRIGPIHVSIYFGSEAVARERVRMDEFESRRKAAILDEHEETIDEFTACIDCQPFSHNHVCIITPDRPPQCGRPRHEIRACALWGANYRPWTRRDLANDDLQYVVPKGEIIDEAAGEWSGVNEAAHRLTGEKLDRVRIHSVFEAPHTSCGCFAALAFRIPATDWIGVMERNYPGTAPGGLTWVELANRAGGKQAAGVCGISLAYLGSRKAFAGDGGLASVKWVTRKAMQSMAPHLPVGAIVAVEDEAATLEALKAVLAPPAK